MAYGRIYTALMPAVSVSASKDLMRLSADSDHVLIIHQVDVTQAASETDEQLEIILQRASTDGTGSTTTIVPHQEGDPTFGGTCVHNLSSDTTAGAILHREGFNIKAGFFWLPPPELRIVVPPSGRFVVRLPNSPGAALTINTRVVFEVIGNA